MLLIRATSRYKKAFKKLSKSGTFDKDDRERLENIITSIQLEKKLPAKFRDHELSGALSGIRECHIKPDLLLMYKVERDILTLILLDLGSHSDLF